MLWGEPLQPLEKVAGRVRDVKAVVRQAAAGRLLDLYRRSLARSPDSLTISPGAFSLADLSPNASAGQLRPSERGCNLIQLKTTFIVSSQRSVHRLPISAGATMRPTAELPEKLMPCCFDRKPQVPQDAELQVPGSNVKGPVSTYCNV